MEVLEKEWSVKTSPLDLVWVRNGYSVRCSVGTGGVSGKSIDSGLGDIHILRSCVPILLV